MRKFRAALLNGTLVAGIVVLAACAAPGPEIRRDSNPSINLASYKTFGYFSPLATDKAGYQSVLTARLKDATRRAMESKGYTYAETNADVLINFYLNIQNQQEIRSSPTSVGYYGYRAGYYGGISTSQVETVNYKAGTIVHRSGGRKAEGACVAVHGGRPGFQGGAAKPGTCDRCRS